MAATAWEVIAHINVSTSRTQIVAGSKMLHHLLPDLIPPIDRQYTFRFFTGQLTVASDRAAFLSWFPQLADIGSRCQQPIQTPQHPEVVLGVGVPGFGVACPPGGAWSSSGWWSYAGPYLKGTVTGPGRGR